ncbi:twin-arginine translocase TatA/TatE family subunit [Labedella populi]|uniref:Sec-independent protein translocase protein TatA n=1 Tax=Labedella populi TaxID=2498850 RepID=A0A3S4B2A9_9MICO|nr:twin-arginine translocase TatA/TatE family subunit [Labedella populi]RWZ61316.1 twin-arginine translocase TatA/TatE family subunit [Labedella populi]
MFANLTGWHLVIILVIVLLLFGATRLPALTRSIGQSVRIFKKEVRDDDANATADSGTASGVRTDGDATTAASARRDTDTTP